MNVMQRINTSQLHVDSDESTLAPSHHHANPVDGATLKILADVRNALVFVWCSMYEQATGRPGYESHVLQVNGHVRPTRWRLFGVALLRLQAYA
ncbi:hypothetical protein DXG01_010898 [Tephrocybe rancida]|nr:hypothetical protein DXG01_010898 [Tephrocybe rancida]